jgi:hypothetical protein
MSRAVDLLLDILAVRRRYRAGMRELLEGLELHLEQRCGLVQ